MEEALVDVALFCGFENQRAFTKAFRSLYGVSSKAYQKKGAFYPVQLPFAAKKGHGKKRTGKIPKCPLDTVRRRMLYCPQVHTG